MFRRLVAKVKRWWNGYLANLERENAKQFGSKPLDCCDLNRNKDKR